VLVFFGAAIIAAFILGKTVLGRYTFAMGSNIEATRLSGVSVDRWQTAVYMLCGLFAGLAGVIIGARLNSAQPALGAGYELGRHCGGGDWRHIAQRRRRIHSRDNHRRFYHQHAGERPAHSFGAAGMADCGDRNDPGVGCLPGSPSKEIISC